MWTVKGLIFITATLLELQDHLEPTMIGLLNLKKHIKGLNQHPLTSKYVVISLATVFKSNFRSHFIQMVCQKDMQLLVINRFLTLNGSTLKSSDETIKRQRIKILVILFFILAT